MSYIITLILLIIAGCMWPPLFAIYLVFAALVVFTSLNPQ